MARKRGGLAGLYDRNKGVIKTLAPIAAGFIPGVGPALGAAIGAAIGGDREGKGYFKGFNAMGAAKGGLSGYGGAKLGQAAKSKLSGMFTGQSPLDKLTGAPKMGLMTQTTGPSSYGAIGSYQPTMPTDAMLSSPITKLTGAPKAVQMTQRPEWYGTDGSRHARSSLGIIDVSPEDYEFKGSGIPQPSLSRTTAAASAAYPGVGLSSIGGPVEGVGSFAGGDIPDLPPMKIAPRLTSSTGASIPSSTLPVGAGQFTGGDVPKEGFSFGNLFGKEGMIEQNKTLLSGIGKGVMGTRGAALEAQIAEENRLQREAELAQRKYEFDKTYGIDAAQEADRKRREDQLQAQRAAFRAMFTGGVG